MKLIHTMPKYNPNKPIPISPKTISEFTEALDCFVELYGRERLNKHSAIPHAGVNFCIGGIIAAAFEGRIEYRDNPSLGAIRRQQILTELAIRGVTRELFENSTTQKEYDPKCAISNGINVVRNRRALHNAEERYVNYSHRFGSADKIRIIRDEILQRPRGAKTHHMGDKSLDIEHFMRTIDDLIRFDQISPTSLRPYPGTQLSKRLPKIHLAER